MDPQSSSSPSSTMSRRNYDAFLSFCGVDTRHTFITHLYLALCQKGVYTFKDSEELEAGQKRSELFNAIKGSRVAVVTFSENYARSKWCLDELQKIMERKGQGKILVIPIFYRVSPRDVRLHEKENGEKGCYQIAMEEMETKYARDSEKMKRWREALWEGGDLIGIELGIGNDEGDVVQDVVDRAMNTLKHEYLYVAKHPIGIDRHLRAIRPSLHMDPHVDDVFMVGIHGQGGVGKTTLSKAICIDIAGGFDDWCFLPNVSERTSNVSNGLAQLQQELLQKLLGDENLKVWSVDSGKQMIKRRLSEERVLVILDDVEELDQLDALAGDLNWFGKGSRIILTTRNEHVLTANGVPIYKVNLLEKEEAENLFRLHAFGTQEKINIDCDLINSFVEYSGKLPLALVVLGSFLRGRSESYWKGKLKVLKRSPDETINNMLKISYDRLEENHKEIFLDVACFFKGRYIFEVEEILDGCGFSMGLAILRERCLITIVDERIEMHNLLVEMGQSIVRDKGNGIPNRLWLYEDFRKIMSDDQSAQKRQAMEGIVLYDNHDDRIIKYNALKDFKSYDVFLSFRGNDTRNTIISHLDHALCQKGLHTFKGDRTLDTGQPRAELFVAIRRSRIAIIMFSENYARSKWCLDELKLIMDLKEDGKLTVVPIFYRVSPEEVRLHGKENNKKGCYQIAMEEMEVKYGKDSPAMESWKKALWKAGDLVGFPLPEGKDEGNCIEEVIKKVMKLLGPVPLAIGPCPIGIDARLKDVEPLLKADSNIDVHMLGIYGPGGVGKTTLSKAICNNINHKFDHWCFLSEVRGTPPMTLQERLLRDLLFEKDLNFSSVDQGKTMIQERLGNKRVLVIFDDVDKPEQLDALVGAIDWFGKGSRIIITTRDIHVLNSKDVQFRYEVKLFDKSEAGDLFLYHASGGKPKKLDIDHSLVDKFLEYANGLPLALVVLGRSLCSRSASEWKSILENHKQDLPEDIISVLKISFDELSRDGQEIFLDIACFFKGWNKDYVVKVLDGCGFQTTIIINILVERCLVTIEDGKLQMHDLLEAMGKSIAHGKCSKDSKISKNRIWLYDDFYDMLSKNRGHERCATKGILLNSVSEDQEPISQSTFGDFECLRLLIIRNVLAIEGSSLDFPSELRWFEWPKYAAQAIDFTSSRKLVGIDLQRSEITRILGKDFKELKYLTLNNCKSLEALPNLSKSSYLEDLNLSGCQKLSRLDDSIGSHDKLVHLNLQNCCNITDVPSLLRSKDFQTINFSCCSKLHKFPVIKEKLLFLKELNLEKTAVEELPDSICNLVALKILNVNLCKELSIIPSSIFKLRDLEQLLASGCPKLEIFPQKIKRDSTDDLGFPNLVILNLQYCNLKEVEFLRDLACFESLKEVYLSGNVFTHVPECISEFKSLEQLWLSCCKNLVKLPEVPSAIDLHIMGCQNLRSLSSTVIRGVKRKFQLDLSDCPQLDLRHLDTSLSLKEIGELQGSAEVIVARKSFPSWMSFQITDCYSKYTVPLPEGILEDDILGLAVSVNFEVMDSFSRELCLVVGQYRKCPIYDIDHFSGANTWFVYIPRRPNSKDDSAYAADINWSSISLEFEGNIRSRIETCGVKIVCQNEIDDQRFMVNKIEVMMDYEYEIDDEYSQEEELSLEFQG